MDKTRYAYDLITQGRRYFLSRPRRFGKSLFVSTLEEVLLGNRELFKDLWIGSSNYHWEQHAVIKLNFSNIDNTSPQHFINSFNQELELIGKLYNGTIEKVSGSVVDTTKNLIVYLRQSYTKIAVLVDEYDHPLIHSLHDTPRAIAIREIIQKFFTTLKSYDHEITFVFITGVTAFSKASLFSGINNLQMLTLDAHYSGICGYNDQEIDHYLTPYIQSWAETKNHNFNEIRNEIRTWHNGYQFYQDTPKVYNPFSVFHALQKQELNNFWFGSATPTFLVEILKKETHVFDINDLKVDHDVLGIFDIDTIPTPALMFQAGYLTIESYDSATKKYNLNYPNEEIKISVQKYLIEAFTHVKAHIASRFASQIVDALEKNDPEELIAILTILFAHIPSNLLDSKEKYYHAILQMIFIATDIDAKSEFLTNKGRVDIVIQVKNYTYIVEIKLNKTAKLPLEQILERGYYERFLNNNKTIVLLGMSFNRSPKKFTITYATLTFPTKNNINRN